MCVKHQIPLLGTEKRQLLHTRYWYLVPVVQTFELPGNRYPPTWCFTLVHVVPGPLFYACKSKTGLRVPGNAPAHHAPVCIIQEYQVAPGTIGAFVLILRTKNPASSPQGAVVACLWALVAVNVSSSLNNGIRLHGTWYLIHRPTKCNRGKVSWKIYTHDIPVCISRNKNKYFVMIKNSKYFGCCRHSFKLDVCFIFI